jgi:plastocyanin
LGALLLIGFITIVMSRVLLSVPKEAATVVALAMAANILGACAFLALRPRVGRNAGIELLLVVLYPLFIGVAIAQLDIGEEASAETHAASSEEGGAPAGGGTELVAENVQFTTDQLTVSGGGEVTITLDNQDSVDHNFSVYENEDAEQDIFTGEIVAGGQVAENTFEAPKPGDYFFRCDLHPTDMIGTLTVE